MCWPSLFELGDATVFEATGHIVSGHTLKHLDRRAGGLAGDPDAGAYWPRPVPSLSKHATWCPSPASTSAGRSVLQRSIA